MVQSIINQKIDAKESFLLANDGQYLGKLSLNQYDPESVSNTYGSYGSQYSSASIFNSYGNYGSPYSALSPFNSYTGTPPAIYFRGRMIGYLTKNVYKGFNTIDPDSIVYWMKDKQLNY